MNAKSVDTCLEGKLLEHRKSTAREGWGVVAALGIPLAVFIAFAVSNLSRESIDGWTIVFVSVIVGAIAAVGMIYAVAHIRARSEFRCRLDGERFTCVSPVDACGDSFDLALDDIKKIEREDWVESCRWYVWDSRGNRHWVTSNYQNPVEKFLRRLERLRPEIERIDT